MPTETSADFNDSMDVDMEIDLGADQGIDIVEADTMHVEASAGLESQPEPQPFADITTNEATPEKVHIRGLDNLTTSDIRAFATEHFPSASPLKVEWIDDTSANLVYENAEVGSQALSVFSADLTSTSSPLHLRNAKRLTLQPHVDLQVRTATVADVKKPHAREASRFYLLNPDLDPSNKKRHNDNRHGRGGRDGRRQKRQRDEEEDTPFDVNMYDDDPAALATRPLRKMQNEAYKSDGSDDGRDLKRYRRTRIKTGDLFADPTYKSGSSGRLRDRSASPLRDGDGRLGFDESDSRPTARRRSRTPPALRRRITGKSNGEKDLMLANNSQKELFPINNATKELFPVAEKGGVLQSSTSGIDPSKELLSNKQTSYHSNSGIELFPGRKGSTGGHRRKDAFDAADGTSSSPVRTSTVEARIKSRNLADRITNGPVILDDTNEAQVTAGFNIRGSAQQRETPGFSIRGAAGAKQRVKELFPNTVESEPGRDLFSRINGRTSSRAKATDMYT